MKKLLLPPRSGLLSVLAGLLVFAGVSGCGGSGSSVNNGGITPTITPTNITIDNAGVIPVFGNSSTSTVVYVHNNSKTTVSGISYSAVVTNSSAKTSLSSKIFSLFSSNKSLSSTVGGSQCSTIAAGVACPLSITTPVLSGAATQGSLEIQASYNQNNKTTTFTQLINYAQVQNNVQASGAKFQAGVSISGYGNPTGYATVYLYGSGQNQVYNVSSMTIDKPGVTVANGNVSGHQIQSNFVQAVEVASPISTSSVSAKITVNSSTLSSSVVKSNQSTSGNSSNKSLMSGKSLQAGSQFTNSVGIAVEPSNSGAILTTGYVPLINTASGSTSGTLLIRNSGNQTAQIGTVTAGAGISNLSGCSGQALDSALTCEITFNVTESGGSANITVPYTGGSSSSSVAANVTWYNGTGAALVSMSSSQIPVTFAATDGGSTIITVENIGGYTLTNISIPAPVVISGSATATLGADSCSGIESLPVGGTCDYVVNVDDDQVDTAQQINIGFNSSYAGVNGTTSYSRVMPITYTSTSNGAIISMTPASNNLSISGNDIESTSLVLTVLNDGNQPANLTYTGFSSGSPSYLSVDSGASDCGATLAANSSCQIAITFGPTSSDTGDSGTSTYTVSYTAEGQTPSGDVSSDINWDVTPYAQSISLTTITASGSSSGDGSSSSQYVFQGNNPAAKTVTLTYTNSGTNSITITGIQDSNSVYAWQIDGSDCIGETLASNETCDIVYTNVLSTNIIALGNIGTPYQEDLTAPAFVFQDAQAASLQFEAQPDVPDGGTTIYAQSNQATLANSVTVNEIGTANESVTVSHTLANASGYTDLTVTTKMENYFLLNSVVSTSECSWSNNDGIINQTCGLSDSQLFGSVTYMVNQTLLNPSTDLNLTTLFSNNATDNGLILGMNPIYAISNLGTKPVYPLVFVTTGTYLGGYILEDANNSTPAPNPPLTSGLAAGDYLCNLQAATNPVTYPGTYKALLAGTNRVPGGSDWVLQSNKTYSNQLGNVIATTDGNAKLPATLMNPIGTNADNAWSGFNSTWGVDSDNCSTWTSTSSGNGGYGTVNAVNYAGTTNPAGYLYGEGDGPAMRNCYEHQLHLYCVQQP